MLDFKVLAIESVDDGMGGKVESTVESYRGEGYLDLLAGTNQNTIQNAIVEQSTHVLICDWFSDYKTKIKHNTLIVADGRKYRITYVDNPVNANSHLEIYLKYEGEADV